MPPTTPSPAGQPVGVGRAADPQGGAVPCPSQCQAMLAVQAKSSGFRTVFRVRSRYSRPQPHRDSAGDRLQRAAMAIEGQTLDWKVRAPPKTFSFMPISCRTSARQEGPIPLHSNKGYGIVLSLSDCGARFRRMPSWALLTGGKPMHGWPDRAWGKFDAGDEANPQWHPLVDHCADVAACCEALLRQPMINRRMAVLAGLVSLDEALIARLSVLAFLHDIGKANRGFQRKILRRSPSPYAGHVKELHWLFRADDELALQASDALRLERISSWFTDTTAALLVASISHHGKPWNPDNDQAGRRDWWLPDDTHDPMATLREMGARHENWFPEAFKLSGPFDAPPEFQHAFAGLVSLADWLGSDRRIFPYAEKGEGDRMGFAREAARTALRDIGLDVTRRRNIVAGAHRRLDDFFEFTPNALQRAVDEIDISPLVVMESETGSGKTEAAFWYFKRLFEAGAVDGLYFALPTRVAATQLHAQLTKMTKALFRDDERPGVVLAVPGYFRVDDVEGERALEKFEVLWADDDPDKSRHLYWAAENPKRYLAAQIAVGTIDQVLLSALTLKLCLNPAFALSHLQREALHLL